MYDRVVLLAGMADAAGADRARDEIAGARVEPDPRRRMGGRVARMGPAGPRRRRGRAARVVAGRRRARGRHSRRHHRSGAYVRQRRARDDTARARRVARACGSRTRARRRLRQRGARRRRGGRASGERGGDRRRRARGGGDRCERVRATACRTSSLRRRPRWRVSRASSTSSSPTSSLSRCASWPATSRAWSRAGGVVLLSGMLESQAAGRRRRVRGRRPARVVDALVGDWRARVYARSEPR